MDISISSIGRRYHSHPRRSSVIRAHGHLCFKTINYHIVKSAAGSCITSRFRRTHGRRSRNGYKHHARDIRKEIHARNHKYFLDSHSMLDRPITSHTTWKHESYPRDIRQPYKHAKY